MSEIYPIIYFTGKLNEVFLIVINVSIQVSSAVKMLPWSQDIFIRSWKCFRHNNYWVKFSWVRRLAENNLLVYSGEFIQRVIAFHNPDIWWFSGQTICAWEIAKWSNFYRYEHINVNSLEEESMSGVRIAK